MCVSHQVSSVQVRSGQVKLVSEKENNQPSHPSPSHYRLRMYLSLPKLLVATTHTVAAAVTRPLALFGRFPVWMGGLTDGCVRVTRNSGAGISRTHVGDARMVHRTLARSSRYLLGPGHRRASKRGRQTSGSSTCSA